MRQKALPLSLVVLTMASFAGAQMSEQFETWPDTPAGALLVKDEKKAYKKLDSDQEAKKFIELFWAKRDPDLSTAVNEFKQDFDLRVEAADLQFSTETMRGSLTDRGRTLLLLGPPSGAMNADEMAGGVATQERSFSAEGGTQVWVYSRDRLPEDTRGENVYFYFSETSRGAEDFQLTTGDSRNRMAFKLLGDAPERLLLHEDLERVPSVGLVRGSKKATDAQLEYFSADPLPWPEGAGAIATSGVMFGATTPLWLYVELPDSVPSATQVIGRVRPAAGGEAFGSFVVDAKPYTVPGGRGYELWVPVKAGEWLCDVALAGDAGVLAARTLEVITSAIPEDGTFISPFYWGVDVRQDLETELGDPFNIGGWHITPRPGDSYANSEVVAYFCFVVRPQVDEAGQAPAKFNMTLYAGERKLQQMPTQDVQLSQIGGDLWMFGSNLPLRGFRKAGEYRLELTIQDPVSGTEQAATIPLTIDDVGETPAAAPAAGEEEPS